MRPLSVVYYRKMQDSKKRFSDLPIKVGYSKLDPDFFWENRHSLFQAAKHSRAIWSVMTEEERDAILSKVRDSLAVMLDRVDEWVPESFTGVEVGEAINIELTLLMADVDSAVATTVQSSSMKLNESLSEFSKVIEDELD